MGFRGAGPDTLSVRPSLANPVQEMEFSGPLPKIDKLINVQKYDTYSRCRIVEVKAGVIRRPWPRLLLLKEQLPDPFVHRAEESMQGPWPLRIKLPHFERPSLVGKISADKHHLDHISKGDVLFYHTLDTLLQRRHFVRGSAI